MCSLHLTHPSGAVVSSPTLYPLCHDCPKSALNLPISRHLSKKKFQPLLSHRGSNISLDAVFTDVIAEKLGGRLIEGAFLGFKVEMVFLQVLEDLRNVLMIFGQAPGVDQDIIDVDNHKAVYIYIYAFSRHFYPKRLTVHSGLYICIVSMCVPWESNPQPLRC